MLHYPDYIANPDALDFDNGIWFSKSSKEVSYPEEGNAACFQVEEDSFWFRHRNDCIVAAVKEYSPKVRFFDIGGGNGFVSKALKNAGQEVVLVEPGKDGCINASKRNIEQIICGTLHDVPLKESSIGACGFFDVIEHIENDNALLLELFPLVKPGGKVYITVPAYSFLWSREDIEAGHYRRYTIHSIEEVLRKAGFDIVYRSYLFSFLPLAIFISRTLPFLLRIKNKPANHEKDHSSDQAGRIIERLMKWELQRIKNKKRIPFGSSCFIIAEKR